jgi:hypothetical protein
MTKFLETIFGGAFVLLVLFGIAIVMAVPTYFLWNWLMPNIFQLPEITLGQALGLNMLSSILFNFNSPSKPKDN